VKLPVLRPKAVAGRLRRYRISDPSIANHSQPVAERQGTGNSPSFGIRETVGELVAQALDPKLMDCLRRQAMPAPGAEQQ
jgi:hypothetical protein